MNPQAAQELLDLIMLDDFVERKKSLDTWSRKWIATMELVQRVDLKRCLDTERTVNGGAHRLENMARAAIIDRMLVGLMDDAVGATKIEKTDDQEKNVRTYTLHMHVVLQRPRV